MPRRNNYESSRILAWAKVREDVLSPMFLENPDILFFLPKQAELRKIRDYTCFPS